MFEFLSLIFLISVVSCVGGASISQAVPSFSNEQHIDKPHTISDLVSSAWKDFHSSMNKTWQRVKLMAGMPETNGTIQDSMGQDSPQVTTETTTAHPEVQVYSAEFTNNKTTNDSFLTNTEVTTDETKSNNDECEEQSCLTWRVLKILGTAVGVGFIVSIFSPVLFYFIILNIGYLCYGITFLALALSCKADKGIQIGQKLLTACQEIGGSSLQNMFSPFPIFLSWLGSASIIGWLVWPYF
ncbi:uncharacterized protein LOC124205467 [Daphnia pulex]|uniref:uncharacterized protein LOC124205467 n=1 Tax=Daphnia pulex TaxID=6669 RepID=UPI001EDF13D5|nr:uncharacterized protein LOC124205467 [Daphnia pulex]